MARTKQTSRQNSTRSNYQRATFEPARQRKRARKPRRERLWMTEREARSPWFSRQYQYDSDADSDLDTEDELGHDDLDDEVLFGSIRGNIVGIRYYTGIVNNNEMVALEREPQNKYDRNAIKVVNVVRQQVGHIKREMAAALAPVMDRGWARLEGVVPFGSQNQFSMPVDISLWGKPEHKHETVAQLERAGIRVKVTSDPEGGYLGSSAGPSSSSMMYGVVSNRRTFLTPSEVRNELDKLFESLNEGDKTTTMEPSEAVSSRMYSHQKQALHWMVQRENGNQLPPFWENKNGLYFNSVTFFITNTKPNSVCGGILADDMGLGKTLQTIALIMTNFTDGRPLAVPVPGKIRQSKILRMQQKAKRLEDYKSSPCKSRKSFIIKGDPSEMIVEGKSSVSRKRKTLGNLSRYDIAVDNITDEESTDMEEEEENDREDLKEEKIMLEKDDPEFKLGKDAVKIEKISSPIASRRPRRSTKKPTRYTYSSEEEEEIDKMVDSPMKKAKFEQVVEKENLQKAATSRKGQKGKKGKGKQLCKSGCAVSEVSRLIEDTIQMDTAGANVRENSQPQDHSTKGKELLVSNPGDSGANAGRGQNGQTEKIKDSGLNVEPQPGSGGTVTETEKLCQSAVKKTDKDGVFCPKRTTEGTECGQSLQKEHKFCVMCGWKINLDIFKERAKMCHNKLEANNFCENIVFPPQKFCSNCGQQLSFADPNPVHGASIEQLVNSETAKASVGGMSNEDKTKALAAPVNESVSSSSCLNPNARPFVPGARVIIPPKNIRMKAITDDLPDLELPSLPEVPINARRGSVEELPDIPSVASCSSQGTSSSGHFTGRTPTNGARSTLIVCPLSVMSNWLDQLEEHIHENIHLDIYTYYGPRRIKNPKVLAEKDIVLTTYSILSYDSKNDKALQKVKWLRVVLDEGHAIRNPNAQQTKAIYALQAERKWVLTGTPIQNSIKDLWSLVNFLQISPFTDRQWWTRAIERPLEKGNESAIKRVQHLMGAIAMRRTKNQMVDGKPIVELPARNVFVEHVKLSEEERSLYEAMQNEGKIIVSRYFQQGTLLHHYGDVLAILMRLRQMCCHPLLVAKAAAAMKEIMNEVEACGDAGMNDALRQKLVDTLMMVLNSGSDEECAICLDSLKQPIITHCAHVFCRGCIEAVIKNDLPTARCPLCRGYITLDSLTEVPAEQSEQQSVAEAATKGEWKSSTKVDALMNGLVKLRDENPGIKSLVVSQFTSLLSLLEIPLRALGFSFVRLDGGMSMKQRLRSVEEFSNPAQGSPTIMLLSLKAGGVGINLVAASRVFLMDPAWNPASEEQCFDRCHRLGQTKDVIITKFIVEDSVEERMMALQDQKRKLMQGAFGQSKQTADEKRTNRIRDIKTLMDL
uniref:Helicase-like transcription factor n=1 Tax=Crassostrea virginica TaxID=6565 RepID=A0A8B8E4U8_CRAVI|nr:helicase-like transcription factor [Crassostrea virginica]